MSKPVRNRSERLVTTPTISVVVPTYDRPRRLADCVAALSQQEFPREAWELVVVDDGTPAPVRVAAAIAPFRDRIDLRVITQVNAGPAAARNVGARKARFEYLAFTDDDCRPHARWLSELSTAFERNPDAVVGGRVVNGLAEACCPEASHQLVEYVVDYFLAAGAPFFPSNNLALPRSRFEAIGGFDERFPLAAGEDRDLCAKCRESGMSLLSAPNAVVEHRHAMQLRGFLRQHFNYGRGAFVCRRLETSRGAPGFRIEPLRFYIDLVREPFRANRPGANRLRIAALLFASQAANAAGFFRERFRANDLAEDQP